MSESVTPQKNETSAPYSLIPVPVSLQGIRQWFTEAWSVLTQHWVLVYPMLLFTFIQDMMAPSIMSGFMSGDGRLFLLLSILGVVWVVFYTGLLGMMKAALSPDEQKAKAQVNRARLLGEDDDASKAVSANQKAPVRVLTLWGGFLDAIGVHTLPMLFGWVLVLLGLFAIGYGTHWVVLHYGGYPDFVVSAWDYLKNMPLTTDTVGELQDGFFSSLKAMPPEQMMELDRLTWQFLGGMMAMGLWLLMTVFWSPALVWARLPVWDGFLYSFRQFGAGVFAWVVLGVLCYVAMMAVQFVGLLHPLLMLLHWVVLMVLQTWMLLTVCVVVHHSVVTAEEPVKGSSVDVIA